MAIEYMTSSDESLQVDILKINVDSYDCALLQALLARKARFGADAAGGAPSLVWVSCRTPWGGGIIPIW